MLESICAGRRYSRDGTVIDRGISDVEARLVIFRPDGTKREIPIHPGRYLIGRHDEANLRVPLPTVSRRHCELVHDGDRLHVRDLGSSNGTFRNEQRIQEAELVAGDILGIGDFRMTVQINGEPHEIAPPEAGAVTLSETPPQPATSRSLTSDDDDDDDGIDQELEETVTKPGVGSILAGGHGDESSIFDFDFDFEDDENPQL